MTKLFQNETALAKMKVFTQIFFAEDSWMSWRRGEGEEEFGNHGGSGAKSFSQETEAMGRHSPRMGAVRSTHESLKCRMHADTLTQLPFFFLNGGRRV